MKLQGILIVLLPEFACAAGKNRKNIKGCFSGIRRNMKNRKHGKTIPKKETEKEKEEYENFQKYGVILDERKNNRSRKKKIS